MNNHHRQAAKGFCFSGAEPDTRRKPLHSSTLHKVAPGSHRGLEISASVAEYGGLNS